ncbi:hypothetical protein Tco_0044029, partial [Tanacetum coccineum]
MDMSKSPMLEDALEDIVQDALKKGKLLNEGKQDEIFDSVHGCRKSLNPAA